MEKITVEICCGCVEDVLQTKAAGATRVELNSALFLGGLTPSVGQVTLAKRAGAEVMAMVRPREGGFCYSGSDFDTMLLDARSLVDAGADGIVFGVLNQDGTVDKQRCRAMLDVIGDRQSVFHRALDVVPDWRAALDILIELGVTRVLTSGQEPTALAGAKTVRAMNDYAAGRIEILPGGGIRTGNVQEILRQTGCNQVHASMRSPQLDPSTAANTAIHFGGALYPPEDIYQVTDSGKVRAFLNILEQ